jgi:hypothetical protein
MQEYNLGFTSIVNFICIMNTWKLRDVDAVCDADSNILDQILWSIMGVVDGYKFNVKNRGCRCQTGEGVVVGSGWM